ncbi:MAG: hypothetical protein ACR2OU_17425, partial [Thermomicrobiales bacterium]
NEGYTPTQCRDFDVAHLDFWDWFESMQNEQVQVHESTQPKLKPKHVWAPKYRFNEDIFPLYYGSRSHRDVLDPVVAAITHDEMDQLMDDWDPNDLPA